MKRTLALATAVLLSLGVVSCSSPAEEPVATEQPVASNSAQDSGEKDVTEDVQKIAKDVSEYVVKATETEPGRISIETSLVDPRGTDGSVEAEQAIKICESVKSLDGVTYVNVQEKDGTSWVLFGHPSVPEGACAEV